MGRGKLFLCPPQVLFQVGKRGAVAIAGDAGQPCFLLEPQPGAASGFAAVLTHIAVLALPPLLPGHRAVPSCGHVTSLGPWPWGMPLPRVAGWVGSPALGSRPWDGGKDKDGQMGRGGPFPRDHIKMSLLCKAEGMPPRAGFHGNCKCQVPCGE